MDVFIETLDVCETFKKFLFFFFIVIALLIFLNATSDIAFIKYK